MLLTDGKQSPVEDFLPFENFGRLEVGEGGPRPGGQFLNEYLSTVILILLFALTNLPTDTETSIILFV